MVVVMACLLAVVVSVGMLLLVMVVVVVICLLVMVFEVGVLSWLVHHYCLGHALFNDAPQLLVRRLPRGGEGVQGALAHRAVEHELVEKGRCT